MNIRFWILTRGALIAVGLIGLSAASASTLDRDYRLGDDPSEGAVTNDPVSVTFDSAGVPGMQQLIDLTAVNSPVYRAITGRPDGGSGRGIEFNAAQQQYLRGPSLNWPEASISSVAAGGTLNYTGIVNRGLQFWVRPTSTAVQTLVMDTDDHGARIDSAGNFSMRYAGNDYSSSVAVDSGTWYHVMVVRPQGAANGSRMYVNGIAVAAAPGGYGSETSNLVVGANTGGDAQTFTGGTDEFFSGIIDDLKLFVIGVSTDTQTHPSVDWGSFNLATDNDFIASTVTGLKGVAGDVTNDGVLNQADKDAFIGGWLSQKLVNGIQVGDLATYGQGDLNLDGITDIQDLLQMQLALSGAGIGTITAADLNGAAVPEPSTVTLLLLALGGMAAVKCRS